VDLDARLIERWTPSDIRPEILDERLVWAHKAPKGPKPPPGVTSEPRVLAG
jgi:hypothetical protein